MEATLEHMRVPLKLDISTGDVITPRETLYPFRLMFEERSIDLLAYPIETVLAEKLETLLSRGTANTRLRDYYDIFILQNRASPAVLAQAFHNTVQKRDSASALQNAAAVLDKIEADSVMQKLWTEFQRKFDYAADVNWTQVMVAVREIYDVVRAEK
jgi:predicted nucleotidyltransferase component of viral defense system